MTKSILTVLIPAYNSIEGIIRVIDAIKLKKNVGVIVSDDSSDPAVANAIKAYITDFNRNDYLYIKHESTGNAVDNWNFLLSQVKSKFFVIVHHDETFSNTLFIDEVEKCQDLLEVMVLPIRIEHPNGVHRNVKSPAQSLLIKLFRTSSPALNFIGGPTALLIIKSTNIRSFNRDLVFYVDVDWYIKVFADISLNEIKIFPKTKILSSITNYSITKSIQQRMREVIISDITILKDYYPDNVFLKRSMIGAMLKFVYRLILVPSFAPYYLRRIKSFLLG